MELRLAAFRAAGAPLRSQLLRPGSGVAALVSLKFYWSTNVETATVSGARGIVPAV